MRILVGSRNPVKIGSVEEAFGKFFPDLVVEGHDVPSGVPAQPVEDAVFAGAYNRAVALSILPEADKAEYFVGLEGGLSCIHGRWFNYGAMCVINASGRVAYGMSPGFQLPEHIVEQLLAGRELGDIADELTGGEHTKQKGGTIGWLTRGVMDRKDLYVQGLIVAIAPFLNEALYVQR